MFLYICFFLSECSLQPPPEPVTISTAESSVTFTSGTTSPGLPSTQTNAPLNNATSDSTRSYVSYATSAQNSNQTEQTQSTTIGNATTYAPPSNNSVNYLRFERENGTVPNELGIVTNDSVDISTLTDLDPVLQNTSNVMKYKKDVSAVSLVQKPLLEAKVNDPRLISFQSHVRNPRGATRVSGSQCYPPARFSRVVDVDNVLSTVFSLQPMSLEMIILTVETPFVMRFDLDPMRDVGTTLRLEVEMHEVLERQV